MKALKFYASWCEPCKTLSKIIESAGDKITTPIEEINIENDQAMAVKWGIRSVPVMILVDETGTEVRRQAGVLMEDKLLEFLGEAT